MILVSACLAGIDCAWDGRNKLDPEIKKLVDKKEALALCPEVLGGRSIPRTKTEIRGGNGRDVLDKKAKVFDEDGKDVTADFLKGAYLVLEAAKKEDIKEATLKSRSPSCGVSMIYDGSFKGKLIKGSGVTAALLKRQGILCRDI